MKPFPYVRLAQVKMLTIYFVAFLLSKKELAIVVRQGKQQICKGQFKLRQLSL